MGTSKVFLSGTVLETAKWLIKSCLLGILIDHVAALFMEKTLSLIFRKTTTNYSIPIGKLGAINHKAVKILKNYASLHYPRSRF